MHITPGTPEWEEFRKDKIGASDAPIIMEVSPWTTPFQLWCERLSLIEKRSINGAMLRGIDLEEEARKKFEEENDVIVFPATKISEEIPWMMATLDGIDLKQKIMVEIKCPGREDHLKALSGEIPLKYYPQLQHQMYVAELDFCFYFSYTLESFITLKVNRDERYIDDMLKKEKSFYECLTGLYSPKLTQKDLRRRKPLSMFEMEI